MNVQMRGDILNPRMTAAMNLAENMAHSRDPIYQLWTVIRGVQPFFPIYTSSIEEALIEAYMLGRHQRLLKEFASENPKLYISAYKPRVLHERGSIVGSTLEKSLESVLGFRAAKLTDLTHVTQKLSQRISKGTRFIFVNSRDPPELVEVSRFEVNKEALETLVLHVEDRQNKAKMFWENPEFYLTPIKFKLSDPKQMVPKSSSPGAPIAAVASPSPANEDAALALDYLETLPAELAFQVALDLQSADLGSICTLSKHLNELFCAEDSDWFWVTKCKRDFPQLTEQEINLVGGRRAYFKEVTRRKVEKEFGNVRSLTNTTKMLSVLFFLTGIIDQDNIHPYPLELFLEDMDSLGYNRIRKWYEIRTDSSGRSYPVFIGESPNEKLANFHNQQGISALAIYGRLTAVFNKYFPETSTYRFVYAPEFFRTNVEGIYNESRNASHYLKDNIYTKTFLTSVGKAHWIDQSRINYALVVLRYLISKPPSQEGIIRIREFFGPRAGDEDLDVREIDFQPPFEFPDQ